MYLSVFVTNGVLKQGGTACIKLKKGKSWWFREEENRTKTFEEFLGKPEEEQERD